jgi:hypothetical protein
MQPAVGTVASPWGLGAAGVGVVIRRCRQHPHIFLCHSSGGNCLISTAALHPVPA